MSDLERIERVLGKVASHRRRARGWDGLLLGLFVASLVWLAAALAFKLLPIPFWIHGAAALAALALVAGGFLRGCWRRETSLETAQWLDRRQGFKERLSAAVEYGAKGPWSPLLQREGIRCVESLGGKGPDSYRLPAVARWTVVALLAGASLGFVPEYRSESWLQSQRQHQVNQEVGHYLQEMAQQTLEHRKPHLRPTEEALQGIEELGSRLQQTRLSRSDALERISHVRDRVENQARDLADSPALKRMQQAAKSSSPGSPQNLQEAIADLQQRMGSQSGDPSALEKIGEQLQSIQRSAGDLNKTSPDSASGDLASGLADQMQDLSDMLSEAGVSLPELEQAIESFRQGKMDRFLEELDLAQNDLEKLLEMSRALERLRNQQQQLGKTLAEQLEKGQTLAAHRTLKEMIQQLQNQQAMEPEQLERMIKEIQEALEPAGQYGQCQAFLSQALKEAGESRNAAAASSLGQAADELLRLMQQYQDMECLMASLEQLKQAQMCVGSCQGWGQCAGGGISKAGNRGKAGVGDSKPGDANGGGKPGAGVGTWAPEDSGDWQLVPQSAGWDNTGLERPDMEGKGHTERADDGDRGDLVSTRVRGRFSGESPMPSITLKGVSIKGKSRVEIQEIIAEAQGDAQSALSQQKISRGHRAAVRSYFDDLK